MEFENWLELQQLVQLQQFTQQPEERDNSNSNPSRTPTVSATPTVSTTIEQSPSPLTSSNLLNRFRCQMQQGLQLQIATTTSANATIAEGSSDASKLTGKCTFVMMEEKEVEEEELEEEQEED
ncbi:hypothetical protein ACFE04_000474 [Oxalis oulophora]